MKALTRFELHTEPRATSPDISMIPAPVTPTTWAQPSHSRRARGSPAPPFKTLHVLAYVDDEAYRRQIKGIRNLQEGRHDLARHVFHGGKGELRQHYHHAMEDQLGALGLILNCVTLWNTVYLDATTEQPSRRPTPTRARTRPRC